MHRPNGRESGAVDSDSQAATRRRGPPGWLLAGALVLAACVPATPLGGGKPGGGGAAGGPPQSIAAIGTDSCQWARDMECDDERFGGTGACPAGTDASDCRALAQGGDNTCQWAYDGECDEPRIGTGVCVSGTDLADCQAAAYLRNRDNSCTTAFNGVCEERDRGGNGACAPRTDTVDCYGRELPLGIRDHHFGRDDRILVDSSAFPWRAIGTVEVGGSDVCTGALVAPDVVLTAAHCFFSPAGRQATSFTAGVDGNLSAGTARAIQTFVNPRYNPSATPPMGGGNGEDWAFIRLDRPLGGQLGYFEIASPTAAELQAATRGAGFLLNQGGYSWDTGNHMSGNIGCRLTNVFPDGSVFHECDTTQGDSGSPIFINQGGGRYAVLAVDSQFFRVPGEVRTRYLAVDSRSWGQALRQFIQGGGFSGSGFPGGGYPGSPPTWPGGKTVD